MWCVASDQASDTCGRAVCKQKSSNAKSSGKCRLVLDLAASCSCAGNDHLHTYVDRMYAHEWKCAHRSLQLQAGDVPPAVAVMATIPADTDAEQSEQPVEADHSERSSSEQSERLPFPPRERTGLQERHPAAPALETESDH